MSSHFNCIGFPVRNIEGYWTLARRAAAEGNRIEFPDGSALVRWAIRSTPPPTAPQPNSDHGPEVWAQIDRSGEVVGATPFFSTGTSHRLAVTGAGEDPEEPLDGWIDGWMEPAEEDEPFSGVFPLRVGLVDYPVVRAKFASLPAIHRVEIVALAHEADLFPDDASYTTAPGDAYRLPIRSFVSAAHFGADDPVVFQESTALISGHLGGARMLTNPVSDVPYWWLQIVTTGVTLHAFADQETLGGEPKNGQILSGSFWLLGRIV